MLNHNYVITKFLSDGTFGRVLEVQNKLDGRIYAMKVFLAFKYFIFEIYK